MTLLRRRWFRFTLRTLFVVLTLVTIAIWAALWGLNERRRVRWWIERHGGVLVYFTEKDGHRLAAASVRLSWWEKNLGERPVYFVGLPHAADLQDEQRVHRVFPELSAIGRCPARSQK